MRVDIADGKYTYIFEEGRASALRYGQPWERDVVGDKLLYCMAAEVESLRQQLDTVTAERNNAWEELRGIREAISANDEESTLDEVVRLYQQLATHREPKMKKVTSFCYRAVNGSLLWANTDVKNVANFLRFRAGDFEGEIPDDI
jgi:hypothetical protein